MFLRQNQSISSPSISFHLRQRCFSIWNDFSHLGLLEQAGGWDRTISPWTSRILLPQLCFQQCTCQTRSSDQSSFSRIPLKVPVHAALQCDTLPQQIWDATTMEWLWPKMLSTQISSHLSSSQFQETLVVDLQDALLPSLRHFDLADFCFARFHHLPSFQAPPMSSWLNIWRKVRSNKLQNIQD